jgi:predicted ATPase
VPVGSLKAVGFSKYRGFFDEQRLELKPVTLLFGHNSVGKSAALRLLPILASAAAKRPTSNAILDYSSVALRKATFGDLVAGGQISAGLRFVLSWDALDFDFTIRNINEYAEMIASLKISYGDCVFEGAPILSRMIAGSDIDQYRLFEMVGNNSSEVDLWRVVGLNLEEVMNERNNQIVDIVSSHLAAFSKSVKWLGAVRASVPRFFELTTGAEGDIDSDGTGVAEALRLSHIAEDGVSKSVSEWLNRTCNCYLTFSASSGMVAFNRQFHPFNVTTQTGAQVAVRDVGEGVTQALPVVTLCHQARVGKLGPHPILAFEQPELHRRRDM